MTRDITCLGLFLGAAALLLAGAWEAGAFVGVAGALTALLAPDDDHMDARARGSRR